MQQDILINWSPQETRVAVVEYGAVQELHVERTLERGLVGNVYLGKVVRVLPGMQSAFIDIGLERAAFLHVADLMSSINSRHADADSAATPAAALQPIEKQLFVGQSLMVQVLKEPIGTKGARLTAQVSIAGRLLVFLPQDNHIGVSQKIPAAQREDLRQRLQALTGDMGGGFILRTNGEDATDAELDPPSRCIDDTIELEPKLQEVLLSRGIPNGSRRSMTQGGEMKLSISRGKRSYAINLLLLCGGLLFGALVTMDLILIARSGNIGDEEHRL